MKRLHFNYRLGSLLCLALFVTVSAAWSQTSSLLSLQTIQVTQGGPLQFTFRDDGTGATNYLAEFSPVVGAAANWNVDTNAVITSLGGGSYQVNIANAPQPQGFYRVAGLGGGGPIIIGFATTSFQATEGGMVTPVITFNAPFTGTIQYTVSGTAGSGDYQMLSGQVQVNNSTIATIPVSLTDNDVIGQLKYLTLRLEVGAGYQLGSGTTTTIIIDENDANWKGTFTAGSATLGFALTIDELNGAYQATLKGDGSGFFPTNDVPTVINLTANSFSATTAGIPVAASATMLNTPASLTLLLNAMNGVTNQIVSGTQIQGAGELIAQFAGQPQLNTTNVGTFLLLEPPAAPSTNQVQLTAAP